jgi:adenine-specific DNA methylase
MIEFGQKIVLAMLLRCHCIQFKLIFGLQSIGSIFINESINAQQYQILLEPFINRLDVVKLTNGHFQQQLLLLLTRREQQYYLEVCFPESVVAKPITRLDSSSFPFVSPLKTRIVYKSD